jgi:hypothetical protein
MKITGIYKYETTPEELESAVTDQWGEDIPAEDLEACRQRTQEHYDGLFLVEIESETELDENFDWGEITQENGQDQVPYDEQPVEGEVNRWVFFFHFLDQESPLKTPLGSLPLPKPTSRPDYLSNIVYYLP